MKNYEAKFKQNKHGKFIVFVCTDCFSHDCASGICNVCEGWGEMLHLSHDAVLGYEDGRNQVKKGFLSDSDEYNRWHKIGSSHLWKLVGNDQKRRKREMEEFLQERWK